MGILMRNEVTTRSVLSSMRSSRGLSTSSYCRKQVLMKRGGGVVRSNFWGEDEDEEDVLSSFFSSKCWKFGAFCDFFAREKHAEGKSTQKMFQCEVCGYRANQSSTIAEHKVNMHSEEIKFQCDAPGCAYKTNISNNMQQYRLVHAADLESQFPFACALPTFRRRSKWEFVQHEQPTI